MPSDAAHTQSRPRAIMITALRSVVTITVPVLLVMLGVRLVMTPLFLQAEYLRPGFPEDPYGFSQADRLDYAPITLDYLLNDETIDFLAQQTVAGERCYPPSAEDCRMYNDRELHHMADVKAVTQAALRVGGLALVAFIIAAAVLWRIKRSALSAGLINGAMLTLSGFIFIIVMAVTAWDFVFERFHELFFADGTWRFYYSDTLIRLFPEQFWFDAALLVGAIAILGAVCILAGLWYFDRK